MDLRLCPGLAERRQVLAGIAVEHQFVVDNGVGMARVVLQIWKLVLRHGHRKICGRIYLVLETFPYGVFFV
jgi:hypothetical protein